MQQVTLDEAKARLADLIDAAFQGETISIAKDEQHSVQLVPLHGRALRRQAGRFKGMIHMSEDFDAPLEEFSVSVDSVLDAYGITRLW
jgi:antitoxin (DNA-binding transcriptional repressor) of toxin-antitoxin stability system